MNVGKFKIVFFLILILLPVFSVEVLAQNIAQNFPQFPFGTLWNPDALATFLGVPSDWLVIPKVIYYVIVPFIVAVTVTYGILTELRIFRSYSAGKINLIISVAMAFLLLPSGILTIIVTYFYAANAFIGLMGFGILFLFGTVMWVYGRGRGMRHELAYAGERMGQLRGRQNHIEEEITKLRKEIIDKRAGGTPETNLKSKLDRLQHLREESSELDEKIKQLHKPV